MGLKLLDEPDDETTQPVILLSSLEVRMNWMIRTVKGDEVIGKVSFYCDESDKFVAENPHLYLSKM